MIEVVVANCNYTEWLPRCIESLMTQSKSPDMITVLDDFSEDQQDVEDIVRKFGVSARLRPKNLGTVTSLKRYLLEDAEYKQTMFIGADNYLHPEAIEELSKHKEDIISYDIYLVGENADKFAKKVPTTKENGMHRWSFTPGDITKGNFIHGSALYNTELAQKVGGYERNPDSINTEEDWMLWKKMIAAGATHKHISKPFLYYNRHDKGYTK